MRKLRELGMFITACFTLAGCVSLVEVTGRTLDKSVPSEERMAVYNTGKKKRTPPEMEMQQMRNKAGELSIAISLGKYPAMKIRGTMPDIDGVFNLVSLDYLGGNTQGWNEFRLDLVGQGSLAMSKDTAILSINGEIEPVQISWGRIRRYDTRITGTDALANLRNRRERILALTEWMLDREESLPATELKGFETYWKPILFPEISPTKKRPEGWQQEGDAWVKAEDIRWNAGYTERIFSEETLRPIRDSGTMLSDREEAADWIYLEYGWNRILETLSRETVLFRQK
jgi:hypothetical protein